MKVKKIKLNWRIIISCIVCFVLGAGFGYIITVCAGNTAHTSSYTMSCPDGNSPDDNGCCNGEIYTDMGDLGFNCCPDNGGDCYPPIK